MKLKVTMVIEEDANNISTVVSTLSEEVNLWSISVEPVEDEEAA